MGHAQPTVTSSPKSPFITPIPTKPWECIAADLASWVRKEYLVIYNYQSSFLEKDELQTSTSTEAIKKMHPHMAQYGSPKALVADNGLQFSSADVKKFLDDWNVCHQIMPRKLTS